MFLSNDPSYTSMTAVSTMINILMLRWILSTCLSWPKKELTTLVQLQTSSFNIILTKSFCNDSVKKDGNVLNYYAHFFFCTVSLFVTSELAHIWLLFCSTSVVVSTLVPCISFHCCLCSPNLKGFLKSVFHLHHKIF